MTEALVVALAYLLGSLPTGYLVGRARGIDIRTVGSRNVGATNVFRTLGKGIGIAVMAADIAKGVLAVLVARLVTDDPWPLAAAGTAIVGHVWPVWLRFRGGKGVAVGGGAVITLIPWAALILVPVWLLVVATTRYVSLASIVCAVALTPVVWLVGSPPLTTAFAAIVAVGVVLRHRANLGRLARGQELRLDIGRHRGAAGRGGGATPT